MEFPVPNPPTPRFGAQKYLPNAPGMAQIVSVKDLKPALKVMTFRVVPGMAHNVTAPDQIVLQEVPRQLQNQEKSGVLK